MSEVIAIVSILGALLGAVFASGAAWGAIRREVKATSAAVALIEQTVNARIDGLMYALADHGVITRASASHLARSVDHRAG